MSNVERIYIDFNIFIVCLCLSLSLVVRFSCDDVRVSYLVCVLPSTTRGIVKPVKYKPLYFANSAVQIPSRSL